MATNGITTLGNRTFLFGGASGIDTSALITAAYNQKKLPSDNLQTKISKNTSKISAYSTLQSLSQSVQTALQGLKKNYSVVGASTSSFDSRTGTLSSSSSTPADSLLGVSIASSTELGSYEIEVQQKAQAQRVGGNSATTDKTTALGYAGTFDIALAGHTAATINVTSGMSLADVASAINAQKDTTGVSASVLKTSASGYQLILTGTETNKQMSVTNITGTDVLQSLGVIDGSAAFVNEIQAAQGAVITLDGVTVTRDTNDFSDLIDGVGLTVKNAEPGTTIQLQVENDTSRVKDSITAFVDAYNALRDFVTTNQTVSDAGEVSSDSPLFGDFTLKSLTTAVQGLLGASYGDAGATVKTLRDAGITIDSSNHLVIDTETLDDVLTNKYDEVRALFETSTTSDNSNFRMISNSSKTTSLNVAIDITYSAGTITDVSIGGDNTLFDINGTLITGKAGTVYEGMSFAYIGTSSTTVNFSMAQGLGDLVNNTIDEYANVIDGTIQAQKITLDELNKDMQTRSDDILARAADFREKLIAKYSAYESKIAASQTILAQIQAVLNANKSK